MGYKYARSACWGKEAFLTQVDALAVAARARKQTGEKIMTYRCRECGRWHIGHGGKTLNPRTDPKQWKNWHWRKEAE